jgi:large subunit ribosomal protein L18
MTNKKPQTVLYRRKRENRTNYNKRLKLLLSGKPRLIVRFTNSIIIGQLVKFSEKGDVVLVGVDSNALKKMGFNHSLKNMSAAYLVGYMLGKKIVSKGDTQAILDTGFKTPLQKGKTYAFLKGVVDAGVKIPVGDEKIYPDNERIEGQHLKNNVNESFLKVKQAITG